MHVDTYVDDDPRALVFGGAHGGVLRAGLWRSRFWTPATKRAGLSGVRVHDLCHTAVALWIAAGANAKQIATWAGHTSVSVVLDRYGHLFEGYEEHVLACLDAFVESASVPSDDDESRGVPRGKAKTRDRRRREESL
jgi:integrase